MHTAHTYRFRRVYYLLGLLQRQKRARSRFDDDEDQDGIDFGNIGSVPHRPRAATVETAAGEGQG